jgi:hypothetical protein
LPALCHKARSGNAIEHGQRTFSAAAAVVYSQIPLGTGLEFFNMDPAEQDKLEQWLA